MINDSILIAFEGLDGVGKTKFSTLVKTKFSKEYENILLLPIDSHNQITKKEEEDPYLSFSYYLNSLSKRLIKNKNKFIIFDRYIDSAYGYKLLRTNQTYFTDKALLELNYLYDKLRKPNITFLLTTSNKRREKNIFSKKKVDSYDIDSLKYENILFWNNYYSHIFNETFFTINTNRNEYDVLKDIINIIKDYIKTH